MLQRIEVRTAGPTLSLSLGVASADPTGAPPDFKDGRPPAPQTRGLWPLAILGVHGSSRRLERAALEARSLRLRGGPVGRRPGPRQALRRRPISVQADGGVAVAPTVAAGRGVAACGQGRLASAQGPPIRRGIERGGCCGSGITFTVRLGVLFAARLRPRAQACHGERVWLVAAG